MSPLLWFQRLFVPKSDESDEEKELSGLEESPFVFGQHIRIVLAMLVAFLSAIFIWWILV